MSKKFQVGDKVRDRYTGAEGVVTIYDNEFATVEWLDDLNRLQIVAFHDARLRLVETAAAAGEGERLERRRFVHDDGRELRITAPVPAGGSGDLGVVDVSGDEPKLLGGALLAGRTSGQKLVGGVPEPVLDHLDDRVEAERELRITEPAPAGGGDVLDAVKDAATTAAAREREELQHPTPATAGEIEAVLENRHPDQRDAARRLEEDDEPRDGYVPDDDN